MPPKGWRKNAEGAYPATSKERDSISIDDILFPKATVNRLARAIIPDGGIISKDSSTAIQRSATVFVSYLLVHARQNAKRYDRKTIGPQDVLAALEQSEFSSFIPSVQQELDIYQAHKDVLKQKRREEKEKAAAVSKEQEALNPILSAPETQLNQETQPAPEPQQESSHQPAETSNENDQDTQDDKSIEEGPDTKRPKTREDTVSDNDN